MCFPCPLDVKLKPGGLMLAAEGVGGAEMRLVQWFHGVSGSSLPLAGTGGVGKHCSVL